MDEERVHRAVGGLDRHRLLDEPAGGLRPGDRAEAERAHGRRSERGELAPVHPAPGQRLVSLDGSNVIAHENPP